MSEILVNTRILRMPIAGIPRYTKELLNRLREYVTPISPSLPLGGIKGHLWEQLILPLKVKNRLLWSPANTGPLIIRRQVVTIHDVSPLDHPEWYRKNYANWYKFILPNLVKRVEKVITVSYFSKERILSHAKVNEDKIEVIYLGVNDSFYKKNYSCVNYKNNSSYVLTVGSLSPRKNLETLFKAWKIVHKKNKDVKLVVVGITRKVFRERGYDSIPEGVIFKGFVNDSELKMLYANAQLFVFPSLYEGFGLPLLEAMAAGIPVVASDCTAIPEVVGDAGLLVNPKNHFLLAEAMITLLENETLRKQLISKGYERVSIFSWDKTAQFTWEVLKNAMGK